MSPEQFAEMMAAVKAQTEEAINKALERQRQASLAGIGGPGPRVMSEPARIVLEKDHTTYDRPHSHLPHVIRVGDVNVDHRDGEVYNEHGQRIGRRVDVYHPGWDRPPGSVKA